MKNKPTVIEKVTEEHGVRIVGNFIVRRLFIWAYMQLSQITFLDEDGLPILDIRKQYEK